MLGELEDTRRNREILLARSHPGQTLPLPDAVREILCPLFLHLRLGIKKIHLRGRAALEKINDPFRLRREVREPGQRPGGERSGGCRADGRLTQQRPQSRHTDPAAGGLQKRAPAQSHALAGIEVPKCGVVAVHKEEWEKAECLREGPRDYRVINSSMLSSTLAVMV